MLAHLWWEIWHDRIPTEWARCIKNTGKCTTCVQTEETRSPSKYELRGHAESITALINVCGSYTCGNIRGEEIFLTSKVTLHHYLRMYLLKRTSKISERCFNFMAWLDRGFRHNVRRSFSNNLNGLLAFKKELKCLEIELFWGQADCILSFPTDSKRSCRAYEMHAID